MYDTNVHFSGFSVRSVANVRVASLSQAMKNGRIQAYCAVRERDKTPVKILVFVIVYQNIITFLTSGMTFLYS